MIMAREDRKLNGWHVLLMFVGGFAVIIGVNLTLAFKAVSTFPGLEVPNSYVASQSFDRRRVAQETLGWAATVTYDDGRLQIDIRDRTGQAVYPDDLSVTAGRPTESAEDVTPHLDDDLSVPLDLAAGNWRVDVTAHAADGTQFEQHLVLHVNP